MHCAITLDDPHRGCERTVRGDIDDACAIGSDGILEDAVRLIGNTTKVGTIGAEFPEIVNGTMRARRRLRPQGEEASQP